MALINTSASLLSGTSPSLLGIDVNIDLLGQLVEVNGHVGIDTNGDGLIDIDLGIVVGGGLGGHGTSTGGDGTSTGGDGTSTGGNGTSTGGDGTSTGGNGTSTGGNGTSTGGNGTPTPGGTIQVIHVADGDAIVGTNGDDLLIGGPGNDHIFGAGGNDIIDGAGGFDESIYQGNFADYTITGNGNQGGVVDGVGARDGSDIVRNVEALTFRDGVYDTRESIFLTNQELTDIATAYRAVNRVDGPLSVIEPVALSIATHQQTLDGYIDFLVQGAAHGSIPALVMASFVNGVTPTSDQLDDLTAFSTQQYDHYANTLHSAFAQLGPYEALGRGFSETSQFQARYGGGTDTSFLVQACEY